MLIWHLDIPAPLCLYWPASCTAALQVLALDASNVEAIACLAADHFYSDQPELALRYYRRLLQVGRCQYLQHAHARAKKVAAILAQMPLLLAFKLPAALVLLPAVSHILAPCFCLVSSIGRKLAAGRTDVTQLTAMPTSAQ